MTQTQINTPVPSAPAVDLVTGNFTKPWWYFFNTMLARTGGARGIDVSAVQQAASKSNDLALYGLMDDEDVAASASVNVAGLTVTVENQAVQIAMADVLEPPLSIAQAVMTTLALMDEAN